MKPQPGAGEARLGLGGPLGLPGGACRARRRALALGHVLILSSRDPLCPERFSVLGQETALVKGPRKRTGKALLQDPGGWGSKSSRRG